MQTDDRKLKDRAGHWIKALYKQFETIPLEGSSAPTPPPADSANKMF